MSPASRERVEAINLRILESVTIFDSAYREIVGRKDQLESLKEKIERIKSISNISETGITIDGDETFCIHDMDEAMEFVIILFLLYKVCGNTVKVKMNRRHFDKEFFEKNQKEMVELCKKYSFEMESCTDGKIYDKGMV